MDAESKFRLRPMMVLVICTALLGWAMLDGELLAADYRTQNFIIMAPTPQLAQAVGDAAEAYRNDLADHWLGRTLPPWPQPCPIRVIAGNIPAQGVTTYNPNPVSNFQMEVVGTPERILDSVLPHEVTHTILATHFGRPLPRWADEGICTTVEHVSERQKHEEKLREYLRTRRGIAMNRLFLLTEYPSDVLPMYAQGYSVCQFLIAQRGPQGFVQFLGDYMERPSWTENIRRHYGYESLAELQEQWLQWVAVGNGPIEPFAKRSQAAGAELAGGDPQSPANVDPLFTLASAGGSVGVNAASDSWYSRQGLNDNPRPATPQASAIPTPRRSDPPSIYSAAQPQPEQGMVPYGAPVQTALPPGYPAAMPSADRSSAMWR